MTVTLTAKQFQEYMNLQLRANPPEVMTAKEVATYLTLHLDTVRAQTAMEELTAHNIGTRIVYWRDEVRARVKKDLAKKGGPKS